MPQQDKTGPTGMGPKTGRGMGPCGDGSGAGLGRGRGFGRTMCGRFYRQYKAMPKEDKEEVLKEEIEDLKQELEMAEEELKEIQK
jgi:hypothetical protein